VTFMGHSLEMQQGSYERWRPAEHHIGEPVLMMLDVCHVVAIPIAPIVLVRYAGGQASCKETVMRGGTSLMHTCAKTCVEQN